MRAGLRGLRGSVFWDGQMLGMLRYKLFGGRISKDSHKNFYVRLLEHFIPRAPALSLPRSLVLPHGPRASLSLRLKVLSWLYLWSAAGQICRNSDVQWLFDSILAKVDQKLLGDERKYIPSCLPVSIMISCIAFAYSSIFQRRS